MCESGRLVLLVNIFYSGMNEKERPTNSSVFEMCFFCVYFCLTQTERHQKLIALHLVSLKGCIFLFCVFFSVFNFSFLSIFASHSFIFSNDEENKKKYCF